jgi:hypothetical protein
MSKLRAVLVEEFEFLLRQRAGLVLILLAPLLVLSLLGRASTTAPVRVLVAGAPRAAEERPEIARLLLVLGESAEVTVAAEPKAVFDPLSHLAGGPFDLLLNYEGKKGDQLSIYTAETDPLKLQRLEAMGAGILRSSAVIESRLEVEKQKEGWRPLFNEVWWAQPALYEDLFMLGTFPVNPLFEYFPQAADPRVNSLPTILAAVLCLFPFLLLLARGRGGDAPRAVPGWREAVTLAAGRSMVACAVTLVSFLFMLILAESLHGVLIKAGIFRMMLFLLPALMASAFLGLGISRLARSPLSIASLSLAYLMVVVLLGGIAPPLSERPLLVQEAARLLPSTFVQPALSGWIFGAQLDRTLLLPLGWLALQSLLYGAFAVFALCRQAPGEAARLRTRPLLARPGGIE